MKKNIYEVTVTTIENLGHNGDDQTTSKKAFETIEQAEDFLKEQFMITVVDYYNDPQLQSAKFDCDSMDFEVSTIYTNVKGEITPIKLVSN